MSLIARWRTIFETAGMTILIGVIVGSVGTVVFAIAGERIDSFGDFLYLLAGDTWILGLAAILGLSLALLPRVFYQWPTTLPGGRLGTIVAAAVIALAWQGFVAAGAAITMFARATHPEDYLVEAAEAVALGMRFVGAAVIIAGGLLLAVRAGSLTRTAGAPPPVEPIGAAGTEEPPA